MQKTLIRIFIALGLYLGLTYLGGETGRMIMYPVRLLITFLHEFGHAFGALITGGDVMNLQVNSDGSGYTVTRGGNRAIILLGGYIGSAIFGNILLYIASKFEKGANATLYILASTMVISALFWFNSLFTTGLLIGFAIILFLIANKTRFASDVLMFLGLTSILYIIQDFNVGPRSDLNAYAELFVFPPAVVWMYIWLAIAVVLLIFNIRMIFRSSKN